MMKKWISFVCVAILLCGCSGAEEKDLSQMYLSMSSSSPRLNLKSVIYDFDKEEYIIKSELKLKTEFLLAAYDQRENAVFYTAKDVKGMDQAFQYDIEKKENKQITNDFHTIEYLIPRKSDVVVIGIKNQEEWTDQSYLIDKKTNELTTVQYLVDENHDFIPWRVSVIPETNDILIECYSHSESGKRLDQYNSKNNSEENQEDLNQETYFLLLKEGQKTTEVLLKKDMPQSDTLISNGEKIIYSVDKRQGPEFYIYDIQTKQEKQIKANKEIFENLLYLDKDSKYLYFIKGRIKKLNLETLEITDSNSEFNIQNQYHNNYMLVSKNIN